MKVSALQAQIVPYKKVVVIGFGLTGQSVIRHMSRSTTELIAMDTRQLAPHKKRLKRLFPKVRLVTGGLEKRALQTADMVVVSPGVSIKELDLKNQIGEQTELTGDIEIFARLADAPIIAITGSNGKSTVATMTHLMINAGGKRALLGGNIGTPALSLFEEERPDVYVLELSSFQLETTQSLKAIAAVVLNISEDHLDRYDSYQDYVDAKMRVYLHAQGEVINRDDVLAPQITIAKTISFGLSTPKNDREFGLIKAEGETWLAQGGEKILNIKKLKVQGSQNHLNILASFALLAQYEMPIKQAMLKALCAFTGLKDRAEQVADIKGVLWINDSKGTNVGATVAAVNAYPQAKILILGGQGKGADFLPLKAAMQNKVRAVLLIGEDAKKIGKALGQAVPMQYCEDLEAAVLAAKKLAEAGEVVLFSPACASFDMFDNYQARGEAFRELVQMHIVQGKEAGL